MRNVKRLFTAMIVGLFFVSVAAADTLELKSGRVVQGKYLGGTQHILRFEVNGEVQTFSTNDIVALTFTGTGRSLSPAPAPADAAPAPAAAAPATAPAPAPAPVAANGMVTVPAGQSILIRMIDGVDSSKNHVGDVFHATLETDLTVGDTIVARKGTDIYGRLAEAAKSGNFSGRSELQLELTRLVIDGRDYPIVSSDYTLQGKGQGSSTAKKVGGGAALGAIIGAIAGGGKGAAIGAGAGAATGGAVQVLTKGAQVKIPSETLLEFRLQQPVSVTPAQS
ncbi:MAG TPA: hypothetical protein VF748_09475 [Candidatus Acidoferrum sp.]